MATALNDGYLSGFISDDEFAAIAPQIKLAHEQLHSGTGLGNDYI